MQKATHLSPREVLNFTCRLERNQFESLADRTDRNCGDE